MKTLKQKVVKGFVWSAAKVMSNQVLSLTIHIVLARLLVPEYFGLLGMISIFTGLALRVQGAGLGESLMRKKNVSDEEYNVVFYYSICVGVIFYLIFFFSAPAIARFYAEPRLIWIVRLLTFNLLLIPLRSINRIQLQRQLDLKAIAFVETFTLLISGGLAILMAWNGCGVWSLVGNFLSQHIVSLSLFFAYNQWLPSFSANSEKSKALFSIGWKLMIANFIQVGFKEIYNVIIGKQYSAYSLGFYIQGMKLQRLPSDAINAMVKSVSFPAFAQIKSDKSRYCQAYRNTLRLLTYINFTVLVSLAAIADPLIPFVFSEKWRATIPFFQALVIIGLMEPVKSLFINILKVEGEAGKLIKYTLFSKIFYAIGIVLTIGAPIHLLVLSQITASILEFLLFSTFGRHIGYTLRAFIQDLLPNLLVALPIGVSLFWINYLVPLDPVYLLTLDTLTGAFLLISISWLTRNPSFIEIQKELSLRMSRKTN